MANKNTYRLLNPYIEGSMDTVIESRKPFRAGKKMYKTVSKYFTNHLNHFYMVIQNIQTKKMTHFKITENPGENGLIDYEMTMIDDNLPEDVEKKLLNNVNKLNNQYGGRKRFFDDSSDSDSSDSSYNEFAVRDLPITRFVYFYLPYTKVNYVDIAPIEYSTLFLPTFNLPVNPSIEIRFDIYRY